MGDLVIGLMGQSGSGKTTIAKELEKRGYKIVHSYTTREPRESNEWGHTFIEDDLELTEEDIEGTPSVIAWSRYNENLYWAEINQIKDKGISIYIIDPLGFLRMKKIEKSREFNSLGIYLSASDMTRAERMQKDGREKAEILERLEFDKSMFDIVMTDYVINAEGDILTIADKIERIINFRYLNIV